VSDGLDVAFQAAKGAIDDAAASMPELSLDREASVLRGEDSGNERVTFPEGAPGAGDSELPLVFVLEGDAEPAHLSEPMALVPAPGAAADLLVAGDAVEGAADGA